MTTSSFEQRIAAATRALLPAGGRVVVACSTGADSTALLAALAARRAELRLELVAAYVDHGLRPGEELAGERGALAALAARLGVEAVALEAPVAAETGSPEADARRARYAALARLATDRAAAAVAVAHTRDDQAETVLLKVVRGTGLSGLGGMRPCRPLGRGAPGVALIRPLLERTRDEGLAYLRARDLPWSSDSSNRDRRFLRNRLRLDALPALREASGPGLTAALLRLADEARAADQALERLAEELIATAARGDDRYAVAPLAAAPSAVVRRTLVRALGAGARHALALERLLDRGGAVQLPGGWRVRRAGESLVRERALGPPAATVAPPPVPLPAPGSALDPEARLTFTARLLPREAAGDPQGADPARLALFDAGRAHGVLEIRRRRPGDRFWPLGSSGRRSLKRFYIDRRIPRSERAATPVVTLDDQPVWIVGHRIDERYKVTPSTAKVLELRASRAASGEERGTL